MRGCYDWGRADDEVGHLAHAQNRHFAATRAVVVDHSGSIFGRRYSYPIQSKAFSAESDFLNIGFGAGLTLAYSMGKRGDSYRCKLYTLRMRCLS